MEGTFRIGSDRLTVDVAQPGGSLYAGTRFDWTGFVASVVLDGKHEFTVPEQLDNRHWSSNGRGLCNEFQFADGFAGVPAGARCIKPGVGLLAADGEEYSFMKEYENQPFPVSFEHGGNWACFTQDALECNGYAFRQRKLLQVCGDALTVRSTLFNTGSKAMHLREYNHNFVAINRRPVDKSYKLFVNKVDPQAAFSRKFPFTGNAENALLTWVAKPENPPFTLIQEVGPTCPGYVWQLVHDDEPVGMLEQDSFTPGYIQVWAIGHVLSTEVFVNLDIQPGESATWSRTWKFFYK